MKAPKTLQQAIQFFSYYENCRQFMIAMRWEDGVVRCPKCGSDKVSYLENARLYFCPVKHPKQKFSLKIGTVYEDSPIGLDKWLPVTWLIANCRNGISSYEVARAIGVTQKSAWFMLHRIRMAMGEESDRKIIGGPVEVDECFIGGKPKNMHARRRYEVQKENGPKGSKLAVMGMLDRTSRTVRTKVIPTVSREVLQTEILDKVAGGTTVYTDGYKGYSGLAAQEFVHETVSHISEYVRGQVHTNGIENFWSLLKRTLSGTYVAVEPFHLDRYVGEQVFRFNNRKNKDDYDRFALLVSQSVGKRLTYAEVTGKVEETSTF
jgi:transposase-like protein